MDDITPKRISKRPSRIAVEKAIAIVQDSRRTHETWLIWYSQNPDAEAIHSATCGDSAWHRDCIQGYDQVLSVLQPLLNSIDRDA